jgi:hypothetical protein
MWSLKEGVGASSVMPLDSSACEIHSQLLSGFPDDFLPNVSHLTAQSVLRSFCFGMMRAIMKSRTRDTLFISLKMQHPTEPDPSRARKKRPGKKPGQKP